jgi:hypothetical protein
MVESPVKSILEMARDAIQERVDYEMTRVVSNIMDPNTKATDKRKLTLTFEFSPDDQRQTIAVSSSAKSTLAATSPIKTALYIAGEDGTGEVTAVEMVPNIPGQMNMLGEDQEPAPMLKLIKTA